MGAGRAKLPVIHVVRMLSRREWERRKRHTCEIFAVKVSTLHTAALERSAVYHRLGTGRPLLQSKFTGSPTGFTSSFTSPCNRIFSCNTAVISQTVTQSSPESCLATNDVADFSNVLIFTSNKAIRRFVRHQQTDHVI